MKTKLRLVFSIAILFLSFCSHAQQSGVLWRDDSGQSRRLTASGQDLKPAEGRALTLDEAGLQNALLPLQEGRAESITIYFPGPDGELNPYRVVERSVMAPELQQRYPAIRSYLGIDVSGGGERIRFSLSPKGFQAMLSQPGSSGVQFLEKVPGTDRHYLLFSRDQKLGATESWKCATEAIPLEKPAPGGLAARLVDDQLLRTYRLAVATTGEYTTYHGGTVADALSAINATLTRVNEVFERDLAIRLELVATTDQVIFADPGTDPFGGNFSAEVQNALNTQLGAANYDIGHLFHQGGEAGNAGFIGSVCDDNRKGSAYAATPVPEGDRFDLDFVAHEMGHQFGANHTWSFDSEGTGVQAEPASGTTIMGYAGIAEGNNVALAGDDYFHYFSIVQITQFVAGISCGSQAALTNAPPTITPQPDYIIPPGTAFVLEGIASDPDPTDILTYAWEQIDDGVVTTATFGPANPGGANFRSLPPVAQPERYFPSLDRIIAGTLSQVNPTTGSAWETVSTIERDLTFALTVRDNAPGGGQVASDEITLRVQAGTDAFEVLSQQSPQTYMGGTIQTLNWDVAGTDQGPVNCQQVDVFLSLDGGQSFPVLLKSGLPNTGSAQIQLPGTVTTEGRFMVKASDNVFLAVNRANFTITEQAFTLAADELAITGCQPEDATLAFTYNAFGGYDETVVLTVAGLPAGLAAAFDNPTVQADGTDVLLTISNTAAVQPGSYPLVLTGIGATANFSLPFELRVSGNTLADPVLVNPADAATETGLAPVLQWQSVAGATQYRVQLATDPGFASIISDQQLANTQYQPSALLSDTEYFWRVAPVNNCVTGPFGAAFTFRTIASDCKTLVAQGLPIAISPTGTPTVTSSIFFADDRPVIGARIHLNITHTYLSDLVVTLRSPVGTEVTLIANSCAEANDLDATFDATAPPFSCANNPAISGVVRPVGSLNSFKGESSFGQWVLSIQDTAPADGGQLVSFGLELCVEGEFRRDTDGDGVFDEDDLCPGTLPGTTVDANGCPVFQFAPDQFIVSVSGEQCVGSADGTILVTATQNLDYSIEITGNGVDENAVFNNSYELRSLAPGSYSVCITGTDGTNTYEAQCYDVTIASPQPLSVLVGQSPDGTSLDLDLDGALAYVVSLNGVEQTYTANELRLDLRRGANQLKITAIPACKGVFEATYYNSTGYAVAPNPFSDLLELHLPDSGDPINLDMFNTSGVRVFSARLHQVGTRATIPVPALPTGIYVLHLRHGSIEKIFKVFRR